MGTGDGLARGTRPEAGVEVAGGTVLIVALEADTPDGERAGGARSAELAE